MRLIRESLESRRCDECESEQLMTLRARVNRLETKARRQALYNPARCPGCYHRDRIVIMQTRQNLDGTLTHDPPMPTPCEVCGRVPEQIIQIMEPMSADLASADEVCAVESGI